MTPIVVQSEAKTPRVLNDSEQAEARRQSIMESLQAEGGLDEGNHDFYWLSSTFYLHS